MQVPPEVKEEPKQERKAKLKHAPQKPRKLLSLQYNYSDSEDEETREDRKARFVSTIDLCIISLEEVNEL